MRTPSSIQALLLPIVLIALTGCSITKAMRVENREVIGVTTMIGELRGAPLVFIGERHDARSHHELQLEVLKAIKAEGKKLALGVEMFEDSSQPALDAWIAGKVPEYSFQRVFALSWRNMPWGLYRDIFLYARDNSIPIVALNAPRQVVQSVARKGFASLTSAELLKLPTGIDAAVSDGYLEFMKSSYPMHGRSGAAFRNISEAQMLRNRVMARHIGDYLRLNPDRVMVVIAGGGHTRGMGGVPAELESGGPSYKIVQPPLWPISSATVTAKDADYLLVERFSWLWEIL